MQIQPFRIAEARQWAREERMGFSKKMVLFALAAGLAAWATVSRLGDVDTIAQTLPTLGEAELDAWFI